jgi:uncharacterized protein (DUF952 family)
VIYHIVSELNWQKAVQQGFYEADSFAVEGFIHASRAEQVAGVLERYYPQDAAHKDQVDLLLLHIDEIKLNAPLKFETAPSVNEVFPHIYGRLNLDAVTKIEKL